MSANDSNLSDPKVKYDLVSALTQATLNANLKQFIDVLGKEAKPLTQYYKYDDAFHTTTSIMTEEEVQAMTGGQDIFTIPDQAQSNISEYSEYEALGDAMAKSGFAYAIQVGFGLPAGLKPTEMPDIISLYFDEERSSGKDLDQTVQYNMYFASFTIMSMAYGGAEWKIEKVEQKNDQPWVFQWLVDLNLQLQSGIPFSSLPPTVQNNLKGVFNLNTETMFSLQQLLLDLNTPELISGVDPSVIGIEPPNSPLYTSLNLFLKECWQPFIENGGIVFNNSVKPDDANYPPSSIVPTDLNFVVSPYSDQNKKDLYTLNYLVMSNQNEMPSSIQPFEWNWADDATVPGIMAVRNEVFVDYLNNVLSPCLNQLCLKVDVTMEDTKIGQGDVAVVLRANTDKLSYDKNENTDSDQHSLSFEYTSADSADDHHLSLTLKETFKVCLEVSSSIFLSGNTIKCETQASVYYRNIGTVIIDLTDVTRYELAKKNTTIFTLNSVGTGTTAENSTAGLLQVTCESQTENLIQTEDEDKAYYGGDNSYLSQFMTLGNINDFEDQVKTVANELDNLMDAYTSQISDIVDGSLGFVFPGAQTYFFANPAFSHHKDLTVQISFQSPS